MSGQGNQQQQPDGNLLASLSSILKPASTSSTPLNQHDVLQLLMKNMPQLMEYAKQGRLDETQLNQLRVLSLHNQQRVAAQAQAQAQSQSQQPAQVQAAAPSQSMNASNTPTPSKSTLPAPSASNSGSSGLKRKSPGDDLPITSANPNQGYGISQTLTTTNPGPQAWPGGSAQGRPTLTAGLAAGRMAGTPAQLERVPEDMSMYGLGEGRVGPRKMTQTDQNMRRSIQDLVSSIDPNIRIEPEVEDLLLDIADEFIDSVTNFGCRLAKHRGGDTLEVRDLQLHLERNHNIRIPGFASDETRFSISQGGTAGVPGTKKAPQGTHMTLRSSRLAAVQQAKKDAKLI